MDIDTSRSMSSRAAEYLRCAKECADAAERTTDPKVRETLLKVVADLMAAALYAAVLLALLAVTRLLRYEHDAQRICANDPSASVCGR